MDLVLLPGEPAPAPRPGLRVFAPSSLDHALFLMREAYAGHLDIASLASTVVVGEPQEWRDAIEDRLAGFFDDLGNCPHDSWVGALNALRNGASIACRPTSGDLPRAGMQGQAAICIGSGPSAAKYLPELKLKHHAAWVFAADSIVSACTSAGFNPDFVTFAERGRLVVDYARLESTATVIAPPVIDPEIVAAFGGRVVWWVGGDDLSRWLWPDVPQMSCGRSAGTMTVAAALAAGCNPIYLIGHDLSYGRDGASHAPMAHPTAASSQADDERGGLIDRMTIPGNCGLAVETNTIWNSFRVDIESMLAAYAVNAINVCDYEGAAIAGTTVGELPTSYAMPLPAWSPLFTAGMAKTGTDPRQFTAEIVAGCRKMVLSAGEISAKMTAGDITVDEAAQKMAVGSLVGGPAATLFRYVFRSVYHGLMVRLHLGGDQKDAIRMLALTVQAMAKRMEAEIAAHPDTQP